ncbi:hypothetical protein LTR56_025499 [Elasticomyces elasticus]|nr:hypothetical protein LTR56_025499 [Elasticomyces elasticus]KAK3619395.1 hypothetical protein LTR22_025993 [Elasticomyces elasticus]KAK4907683.1 hypothetical protein LTR49_023336 [Elasticomyces elasticus]KAK5747893.1 hypothetical protein LTS12_022039 [Elasticomyces elasticus]
MSSILVTYSSAAGSTASIADFIASNLRARFSAVHGIDCMAIEAVPWPNSYRAIVLGSAIHGGAWLPAARNFLVKHVDDIDPMPFYIFSVGAPTALPKWMKKVAAHAHSDLEEKEKLMVGDAIALTMGHPVKHQLFNGVTDSKGMNWAMGIVFSCIGAQWGDFREWDKVIAFSRDIADDLQKREW